MPWYRIFFTTNSPYGFTSTGSCAAKHLLWFFLINHFNCKISIAYVHYIR